MMKRKKQKEHIEVGPLERKLFVYLYGIKVAKSRQILRDVFTGYNIRSLQNRLNKLCRFKLIRRNFYEGLSSKMIYHLGASGFSQYIKPKGENVKRELGSRAIHHDLDLVDIRFTLLQSKRVKNYYPENLLSSDGLSFDKDRYFMDELRPDAVVEILGDKRTHCAALEYEYSPKYKDRYKTLIARYYNNKSIPFVLYIGKDEALTSYVRSIEKEVIGENTPKFYYSDFSKWKEGESQVFTDLRGNSITL
jgi:hypothetical protein